MEEWQKRRGNTEITEKNREAQRSYLRVLKEREVAEWKRGWSVVIGRWMLDGCGERGSR